jgi:hypothetical protein
MQDQSRENPDDLHGLQGLAAPVLLVTVAVLVFIGLSILLWPPAL